MLTGHVYIATSLDGFIARKNGELDWLLSRGVSNEDYGYNDFMSKMDGIVMGRGTFEKVLSFDSWPYNKPVVVLSKTFKNFDAIPRSVASQVRVFDLSPEEVMTMLAKEGWMKVYVDGGQLVQSFLRASLIDSLVITKIPVLIGEGKPLFGLLNKDVSLKHVETKSFPSGFVQSFYEIEKS